jgi:hypothetical protein
MNEAYFEILVYTCRQAELVERVEREAGRVMADVPDYGNGFWEKQKVSEIQRHLYPIRFNEAVGAIEVHKLGSQLRADWWFTGKQRVVVGARSRGEIRHIGKLLEKNYNRTRKSSAEIFEDFREALGLEVRGNRRLKWRFVDFEAFDRCGPYVDWRAILGLEG